MNSPVTWFVRSTVQFRRPVALWKDLQITGDDQRRNAAGEQAVKEGEPLVGSHGAHIAVLCLAQQLHPLLVKVIIVAHQLQPWPVDAGNLNLRLVKLAALAQNLQFEFLYD